MTASPDPAAAVAVELAGLRARFDKFGDDLGEVKSTLAVLVERSTRTDADLRQLREDHNKKIAALEAKVEALEDRRFPLPVVGALATVGALCVSVIGLLLTR